MKKSLKRIVAVMLSFAMILTLFTTVSFAAEKSDDQVSVMDVVNSVDGDNLYAGAGAAAVKFPTSMFTEYGNVEGFSGEVESDPYVRVLLLSDSIKAAIVQCELVNVPSDVITSIKEYINQVTGTPVDNVWVHANHTITTPHAPSNETARAMYVTAVMDAAKSATDQAWKDFQPAVMGVATGTVDVNKNRNQLYGDGQYYVGSDGTDDESRGIVSNKEMTIIGFQSTDGETNIGMIMSYGVKPTTIDNAEMSAGTRKISSDLTGLACVNMSEKYSCPVMFIMGASGDQCATRETNYYELDATTGKYVSQFESVEKGIEYVKTYGAKMTTEAEAIADTLTYTYTDPKIQVAASEFTWDNSKGDGQVTVEVYGMVLGDDVALIGLKPEVDAATERELWDASPYKYTIMASFMNGDQKYMPHKAAYDAPQTVEGKKSGFAVGAAEEYVKTAVALLKEMKENSELHAGAGAAEVNFPTAMFTDYGNVEGFSGEVESTPYVRVILLQDEVKAAIVQCELVNVPSDVIASIKKMINTEAGVPEDNVWVHANHTITTPHAPSNETARAMYVEAVTSAAYTATKQAIASFQPAKMAVATGTCDVNKNRNQLYADGNYYVGSDGVEDVERAIVSNKEMTIIGFQSLDGKTNIGMIMSYGVKPTTIDNAEMSEGTRKISSDLTGLACVNMSEKYSCPVMFIMGASGDQCATRETNYYELDETTGKYVSKFESVEKGIEYVKEYGAKMTTEAEAIADTLEYTYESADIVVAATEYTWDNSKGDGQVTVEVYGMVLGKDVGIIGLKPEVDAATERELWDASTYKYTIMASFMNGDQKYMPHKAAYDSPKTVEGNKSGFAVGAAEQYVTTASGLLNDIAAGKIVNTSASAGGEGEYSEYTTTEFAGMEWYVLDTDGTNELLLAKNVITKMAFNTEDTATTWETSAVRAYLNGEFYNSLDGNNTIVETTNTTKASSYGVPGGNDTVDKVFLLSVEEAETYIVNSNAAVATDSDGNAAWWSLRSMGEANDVQTDVDVNGKIDYHGPSEGVVNADAGVRPAMWVDTSKISADNYIVGVSAIADVDADGAKTKAIVIEYKDEITNTNGDLKLSDFEIEDYDILNNTTCELGENPGAATKVYINDEDAISSVGKNRGKFVIIEVNTDYQRNAVPTYTAAMAVGVKQVGTLYNISGTPIVANTKFITNYTESTTSRGGKTWIAKEGSYAINNVDAYKLYTKEDGTAFHATNCFEEATGESVDVDLPYALYVPEDYDPSKSYGLVLQIHDAGTMGDDPMLTLTESQACANFASAEVQAMAKANGMDGLIVVAPMINDSLRSTRDNYTMSAAVPATWQLLDYITETYSINMNKIFGTGQSMGGMQVIAMAAQRDNYFAGIWEHGCQWGSNYNKESEYTSRGSSASYYASDDATIWRKDDDGNDSELGQNFYYLISDDNLLISNCQGDAFSTTVWEEATYLINDITGVKVPYISFNPLTDSIADQNAAIKKLVSTENNGFGWYWYAYSGGSHMLTWIYGHKLDAGYEWLLSQTKESEHERSKLTQLANDWEAETDPEVLAEKQTEERFIQETDGVKYYFAVPAEGAGTRGYNSGWFSMGKKLNDTDHYPGWTVVTKNSMYRLYNPNSGEHLYTSNKEEVNFLTPLGWQYEGIAWAAPSTGDPVYRLYNPNSGDHHYTMNEEEKAMLLDLGWQDEGIGWYSGGTMPVYRLFNPNAITATHHYTALTEEKTWLVGLGWQDEDVAWYGYEAEDE